MNNVVGYIGRDNQGNFMGLVHPVHICLGENNVSRLLRFTLSGVYICGVHHSLGWSSRFLGMSIMHAVATPSLMGPPKYDKDLTLGG